MSKVHCKDCAHFKEGPWDATKTGCWHPDNMSMTQGAAFLDEQQEPGDHEKINLRGGSVVIGGGSDLDDAGESCERVELSFVV